MAELHDPTREALSEVVTALVRRHGGATAVSRKVSVDRTRVHDWMNGNIGIDRLGQLAYALDEPLVVSFGPTYENAAPLNEERLERIERMVTAIAAVTPGVDLEEVERVSAELKPLVRKPGESHQTEDHGIRGGAAR